MKKDTSFILQVEGGFNFFGYIPFLGTLTGAVRIFFAAIFLLVGNICIAVAVICGLFCWMARHQRGMQFWRQFAQASTAFVANQVLNSKRGILELVPILGGGCCFLYDRMMGHEQLLPYRAFPKSF